MRVVSALFPEPALVPGGQFKPPKPFRTLPCVSFRNDKPQWKAEVGHQVICVDNDATKIKVLQAGGIPIYEPDLEELVKRNVAEGRLSFTASTGDTSPRRAASGSGINIRPKKQVATSKLADGAPGAPLTQDAKEALEARMK
jgi:hypothetical protein